MDCVAVECFCPNFTPSLLHMGGASCISDLLALPGFHSSLSVSLNGNLCRFYSALVSLSQGPRLTKVVLSVGS